MARIERARQHAAPGHACAASTVPTPASCFRHRHHPPPSLHPPCSSLSRSCFFFGIKCTDHKNHQPFCRNTALCTGSATECHRRPTARRQHVTRAVAAARCDATLRNFLPFTPANHSRHLVRCCAAFRSARALSAASLPRFGWQPPRSRPAAPFPPALSADCSHLGHGLGRQAEAQPRKACASCRTVSNARHVSRATADRGQLSAAATPRPLAGLATGNGRQRRMSSCASWWPSLARSGGRRLPCTCRAGEWVAGAARRGVERASLPRPAWSGRWLAALHCGLQCCDAAHAPTRRLLPPTVVPSANALGTRLTLPGARARARLRFCHPLPWLWQSF